MTQDKKFHQLLVDLSKVYQSFVSGSKISRYFPDDFDCLFVQADLHFVHPRCPRGPEDKQLNSNSLFFIQESSTSLI